LDDVLAAWAGLGYYARARNLHACARAVVAQHSGQFPADPVALRALPGIGRYTAAAIAAIAFDRPVVPVDGNVERVLARVHALAEPLPGARDHIRALADALGSEWRAGDFAQALMDLGATLCTPQRPACFLCPWRTSCAAAERGQAELFPYKVPKRAGELRRGAVFFVRRSDGAVLVRTRPPQGLLGGMTELPTTPWSSDFDIARALERAPTLAGRAKPDWRLLPQAVTHVFTHFPLELAVYAIEVPTRTRTPAGMRFVAADALDSAALPTVMRKVVAAASEGLEPGNLRPGSSRRGSGRAGRRSA
jgi:A/G-specific adenine glycosylase